MTPRKRTSLVLLAVSALAVLAFAWWSPAGDAPEVISAAGVDDSHRDFRAPVAEDTPTPPATEGRVVDERGDGLGSALVCSAPVLAKPDFRSFGSPICARSSAHGEFTLQRSGIHGVQRLVASAPGHTPGSVIAASDGGFTTIVLERGGVPVSGIVLDAWGGPIDGALLMALDSGAVPAHASSDGNGRFDLTTEPGAQYIRAWAPGYAPSSRQITAPHTEVEFKLIPESSIHGRVEMADNGEPVVGAHIEINGSRTSVETDDDGRFSVGGLAPGRITVSARSESTLALSKEVMLDIASSRGPLVLRAYAAASLEADIAGADGGTSCDGGRLTLVSNETNALLTFPIVDGHSSALGLLPGSWQVSAGCPGGPLELALGDLELHPGSQERSWTLPEGHRLGGTVLRADGELAPGVKVTARVEGEAFVGTSDAQGRFRLFGLPSGEAVLEARPSAGKVSDPLTFQTDKEPADIEIRLHAHGTIEGWVVDDEGEGIADREVLASDARSTWRSRSDGTGHFSIEGLDVGSYDVGLEAGDDAVPTRVDVEAGEVVSVELEWVGRNGSLTGRVLSSDGSGIRDAFVYAVPERRFTASHPWPVHDAEAWVLSDEDGRYAFDSLSGEHYRIQAETRGGERGVASSAEPIGGDGIVVRLQADGTISGRVLGIQGETPALTVSLKPLPVGAGRELSVLDANGEWAFEGVPPGEYVVDARAGSMGARSDPVELGVGESETGVELRLEPAELLRGRILDVLSGEPIEGARVLTKTGSHFWGATSGETANVSGQDGGYELEAPRGQQMSLTVMPPVPYSTGRREVVPRDDGVLPDVHLAPRRAESGAPRGDFGWTVRGRSSPGGSDWVVTTVAAEGEARDAGVEPGISLVGVDGVQCSEHPPDVCRTLLLASVGQERVVTLGDGTSLRLTAR